MDIVPSAAPPALTATICILDDNVSMLRAIERLLSSDGLEAQLFSDPLRFLAYAKSHCVGVAVVDVCMPGLNGLQVKEKLQTISPKTRVIIITADEDDSVRNQAMQSGTVAFFIKPFDDGEFLAAVYQAMASAT
jgi:FixJ family two-component response regulator